MFRLIGILPILFILSSAHALPAVVQANIDRFVSERMEAWSTPGLSLVVVQGNKIIYNRGYGFADLEAQRPMTEDTLVMLGSTTKTMTALAVMQLVEAGRIELDAPVTRYLPWFETADGRGGEITLRHLMSHSSGFPWGFLFTGHGDYPAEMEAYVHWLGHIMLEAAPGARYQYTNDTFVILGLIVQEVSGMAYEDYMAEHVFRPLGMTRTTFDVPLAEERGLAKGYRNEYGVARPFEVSFVPSENPAGKVMTSSTELANYLIMLLNGGRFGETQVISEASLAEMWTPVVPVDSHVSYGLAWFLADVGAMRLASHPGSVRNSGSWLILVPEARLGVGALYNTSMPLKPLAEIAGAVTLATLLFGDAPFQAPAAQAPSTFRADPARWQGIIGEYGSPAGPVHIFTEGDRLLGTVFDYSFELEPYSDSTFVLRGNASRLEGATLQFQAADPSAPDWLAGNNCLVVMGQVFACKKD